MPAIHMSPVGRLKALVNRDEEVLGRLAAPLWARAGRRVTLNDLAWATAFGGDGTPACVWEALVATGAIAGDPPCLHVAGLARLLAVLTDTSGESNCKTPEAHESEKPILVWTLPDAHPASSRLGRGYVDFLCRLIDGAEREILLVAPYIEASGISFLNRSLTSALARGLSITIVTHGAMDLASAASRALEGVRRNAEHQPGTLTVFAAAEPTPLIHAKLAVIDSCSTIVGSANLTAPGLSGNVETGVVLGRSAAEEVLTVIQGLARMKQIVPVFQTGEGGRSQTIPSNPL